MKQFFITLLFLLFYKFAFSQENTAHLLHYNNEDASVVLKKLEKIYDINFSYSSDLINTKKISLHKKKRTLDEVLFEISDLLQIQFNKLDSKYIYITKSNTKNLDEVVVVNYLTKGISKGKNGVFKINPKKINLLPGLTEADILESIQQLPGVISINETATNLTVRAGTSDQNRIIWDGITIYQTGHLFGMVSVFNPNIANKVNFHNKGTNAKFGERISSVIDISTSNELKNKSKFEIGINGINADVLIETPIIKNKLSLQASFRRSYEDVFETYTFKSFEEKAFQHTRIDNEFFYFKDYNLKVNYLLNKKNNLFFSLIHIDNDLKDDHIDPLTNNSYVNILDAENDGYNLRWDYNWSDKIKQQTNLNLSHYRFNYNFIKSENNDFISDFSKQNTISDFGFSTEINNEISPNKTLAIGYQNTIKRVNFLFKEQKDILYILDRDNSKINTHSIYVNFNYKNLKFADLYSGLRINYYSKLNAVRLEPRIVLTKKLNANLKLQLTGEIKNQIISQIDETILSDLSLENKLWRLADENDYPIINSLQISSGLTYVKNKWTFDVDFYHKNTDGISALALGFLNPNDGTIHIGKQKITGLDFYLKKKFNAFETWLNYSFINAKNKYEGLNNNTYFTANTEIKHVFSANLSYKYKKFQVALNWKLRSGKPLTDLDIDESGNLFFDGINTEKLPSFHRLDISSTYNFLFSKNSKTKGKIGFSIRNVYNNRNHINTEFTGNNAINEPIVVNKKFSIGITPNIVFRVYW